MKIFIIAGEVSGDVLGAKIMRALRHGATLSHRGISFQGIGGENMRAVGLYSLFPMSDLAVMGITEVVAHARTLTRRIRDAADAVIHSQPDVVITIDSPGFAKAVVKKCRDSHKLTHTRFVHIVAPQVWAWRPRRAKKFAKLFDKLYAFFDFEVPYFTKYGLDTMAVGHPIADGLMAKRERQNARCDVQIALIPGSRMSEVKKLLPIYRQVVNQISHLKYKISFFIPVVETTEKYIRENVRDWNVIPECIAANARYDLFAKTDIAIAASGTVSVELAIMHIPAVIVYKMNRFTEWFARHVLTIKWVSLVNLLLSKSVYPELLGRDATAENIVRQVQKLLPTGTGKTHARKQMISELTAADKLWRRGRKSPAQIIADDIIKTCPLADSR